jgi:hypothetical protein
VEVPEVLGEESSSFVDNIDIEYFDGGGFSIVGVIVAPYCNIIMVIMSVVFIVGGILLTVIHSIDKQQVSTENNLLLGIEERKFAGPLIITIGAIMLNIGVFLSIVSCRAHSKRIPNPTKYDPMGSTITEESFFSILPSEPSSGGLPHPFYIHQHSLDEKATHEILEKRTDVGVQVEPVGSGKPESLLELDPAQANILEPAKANMLEPAKANMPLTSYKVLQAALQRFETQVITCIDQSSFQR